MKNNKNMINIEFDEDGWFSKFYKFSTNLEEYEKPTSNGCKVAWTTLFAILLIPLTWWNIPYNLLQKDINERPPNLIAKALLGFLFYVIYLLLIALGIGLFVSGVNSDGDLFVYFIDLVDVNNLNSLWLFLIFPILSILCIGICIGLLIGLLLLIYKTKEYFSEYNHKLKLLADTKKTGDKSKEMKGIINIIKLGLSIKKKICPVINWK